MYLNVNNQLTLLHDLLYEQTIYHSLSYNETRQIKKLVQTMIKNRQIDQPLLNILPEIYYYGIQAESAQSIPELLKHNRSNIKKWLKLINETKQKIS